MHINDRDPEQLQASFLVEKTPRKVKFQPAYSGGKCWTDGVSIPEPMRIGEEMYPAGTSLPIVIDLATVGLKNNVPILYNHNAMLRLGHTETISTDGKTIVAEGILESPSQWAKEVVESVRTGAKWQASVGSGLIDPSQKTIVQATETVEINGLTLTGPFLLVRNLDIIEISLVPAGADRDTEVLLASFLRKEKSMTLEEFAAEKGFRLETLDDANRAALEALFNASQPAAGDQTLSATGELEGEKKEEEELNASTDPPAEEKKKEECVNASSEGESEGKKEEKKEEELKATALLKRIFPSLNTPSVTRAGGDAGSSKPLEKKDILQAGALLSLGVPSEWLEKKGGFSARCIEAADRQSEPVTLQTLMGEQLKAAGVKVDYRNSESLVHQYGELMRASGVSTKSFSDVNVFSPIIDKQMRYKYDRLESIWTKLYRKRTVVDFKDVATVDFDTLGRAKLLAENEDYPEVLLKSSGGLFKVSKIGVTAAISFESQINDDMGVLDVIGDELVNMIADKQVDLFWKLWWELFKTNYTAANGNKITAKLSVEGLSAAKKAFSSKKNANGRFLNVPAKHLLVPSALEDVALHLFEWKWGESNMSGNIHVGKYDVWSDPYLGSEGGYTGASDTGWFMLGDVSRYPLGEYAVMRGYEMPRIKETWYDHKDALNLRALGTIGFHGYTDRLAAVYSDGTK